jgi:hypothetical protein
MAIPDERKSSPLYPNSNRRKSTAVKPRGFCYAAVQRERKFCKAGGTHPDIELLSSSAARSHVAGMKKSGATLSRRAAEGPSLERIQGEG